MLELRPQLRQVLERAAVGESWDGSAVCSECAESAFVGGCPRCNLGPVSNRPRPSAGAARRVPRALRTCRAAAPRVLTRDVSLPLATRQCAPAGTPLPPPLAGIDLPASLWTPPPGPQQGVWQHPGDSGWQVCCLGVAACRLCRCAREN
jgi:hypothetical protein